MLEKKEFDKSDFFYRISVAVTLISGIFSAVVFILVITNYLQIEAGFDPVDAPLITQLREDYASATEQDPALAAKIQHLDFVQRKSYFTSQEVLRIGGILLLIGCSIFVGAFKSMARWKPELPALNEDDPAAEREFIAIAESRKLIVWVALILLGGALIANVRTQSAVEMMKAGVTVEAATTEATDTETINTEDATTEPEATPAPVQTAKNLPSWDDIQNNWPSFRGPGSNATAHFTNPPTTWNVETGEGIKWKVPVPKASSNSPVVWGNRLFMSGADETTREVYCYDTETGELLWTRTLEEFEGTPEEGPDRVDSTTGYAASTMVAHGDQVFAIFANGDIVSYDFDGNLVWGLGLGLPEIHYGYASSLIALDGNLFVQLDLNEDPRLLALDIATGKKVWQSERDGTSWASPILAKTNTGIQLIANSHEFVDGYDPITGTLLWSQQALGGEVAPSPVYADGLVFVANEYAQAAAMNVDGPADTLERELLWTYTDLLPDISSPAGDGERFYIGTSYGEVVALDAKTGEELWLEEVGDGFYSSPIIVGDRIFVFDGEGVMHVVRAASTYEHITSAELGEKVYTIPAILDGRMYIRGETNLYCIENKDV
jgi:outer membrane protein assembly factor BamB